MRDMIRSAVQGSDLKTFVKKLSKSSLGQDIRKSCQQYFPLKVALIEKVKVIRRPKKDVAKVMELHELKHGFDPIKENEEASEEEGDDEEEENYDSDSDAE